MAWPRGPTGSSEAMSVVWVGRVPGGIESVPSGLILVVII